MEPTEIIYPLNGLDIIPVKAEEVVCFHKEVWDKPEFKEELLWIEVELENGTILCSKNYKPSEANNLLRTLLKKNDFVLVHRTKNPFSLADPTIRISGVRFLAVRTIGKYMDYIEYGNGDPWTPVLSGKVVESTVVNYKKWKNHRRG